MPIGGRGQCRTDHLQFLLNLFDRHGRTRRCSKLQSEQGIALHYLLALRDMYGLHNTGGIGRHLHAGLGRLQHHYGLIQRH